MNGGLSVKFFRLKKWNPGTCAKIYFAQQNRRNLNQQTPSARDSCVCVPNERLVASAPLLLLQQHTDDPVHRKEAR